MKKIKVMETRVSLAIQSLLTDVLVMVSDSYESRIRLHFIKHLINKYPNTDMKIDVDAEWESFQLS
jgi:hypothetical protein